MSSGREGTGWACWWLSGLGVSVREVVRGGGGKKRRKGKRKKRKGRKKGARERVAKGKAAEAQKKGFFPSPATCPARVGCFLTSLSLSLCQLPCFPFLRL